MTGEADAGFEDLLVFLQQSRGFDFGGYKRPSLMRRVSRRLQMLGIGDFEGYKDYLEVHPAEFALLFNTILINVTSFFRDADTWDYLAREVVPGMLERKAPGSAVRIWSAGCAAGQEAYTIAMLLAEALGWEAFRERVKIYATDVDEEALAQARQGSYSVKEVEMLAAERLERYFDLISGRYVFRGDLRRAVIFGRNDLLEDAPISRLDLLFCRNTLMYFNAEAQARILGRFHFALNGDGKGNGALVLGRAEMLLTNNALFTPLDLKMRVFAKVPPAHRRASPLPDVDNGSEMSENPRLRDQALEESPVARIVVDANGALAIANARARVLFSINAKDLGRPLKDLEISYRPAELRALIEQAHAERRTVTLTSVERRFADGEVQFLDVVVTPLFADGQKPLGAAVSFLDVTRGAAVVQRGAADHQRGAAVVERGARDHQRGAAVDQRRARDDERGAAVDQRGAADGQRGAAHAQRGAEPGQLVPRLGAGKPERRRGGGEQQPRRDHVEPPRRGPVGPARRRGAGQGTAQPGHRPAGGRAAHRDPPVPGRRNRPPGGDARGGQPPRQENQMPRHLLAAGRRQPQARRRDPDDGRV
jgi:PAS domain S-box-containing protein